MTFDTGSTAAPARPGRRAGCRRASPGRWLALAAGAVVAWPVAAQSDSPPTLVAAAAPVPETETDRVLDTTRQTVRELALGLARGVNGWFGDKPFEDGGSVKQGRLSVQLLSRQHETLNTTVRFHARWRLPNVGEQSYLYLGRGDREEVVKDRPEALTRVQRLQPERQDERTFFAGLAVTLREVFEFRLGLRGGLKPYVQASYQHPWQLSPADQLQLRETLFWTLDDHLGSTTVLSYEHAFSPTLTGRWLNAATLTQKVRHVEWSSNLGAYKSFGGERLLSVEGLMSGTEGSGVGVSDYGLQTRWEQPVHRDWLIGEVTLGHFWPKKAADLSRERAWAVGVGLKLKF